MSARGESSASLVGALILGRYQVTRCIGEGGMGTVYELRHKHLGRRFAAKTLSPDLAKNEEALARFRREADIIAGLRHPNIVDVIDWDFLDDGAPVLVMEYLEGEDLAARLERDGPLPWPRLGAIADRVLSALCVAHAAGVVHRDLKPSNIFLATDDAGEIHPKVVDFGISKIAGSATLALTLSHVLGTPSYMSPEQAEGKGELIGAASDVWAMGAILYEMATAQTAYSGDSVPAILYNVCHGRPAPVRDHRPDVPPAFAELLDRVLSRDPARRIVDASHLRGELRAALAPVAGRSSVEATPVPAMVLAQTSGAARASSSQPAPTPVPVPPAPARPHRRRLAALAAVAVAAAFIALGALIGGGGGSEPDGEARAVEDPAAVGSAPGVGKAPSDGGVAAAEVVTPPGADAAVTTTTSSSQSADAAVAPREVVLTVTSRPRGAVVYEGGRRLGRTPLEVRAAVGTDARILSLRRRGYESHTLSWRPLRDETAEVSLTRRPAPPVVDPDGTVNPFDR